MSLVVDIKKKLNTFNLEVAFEAGDEKMALLGTSGSGKSMTLKCIAGIEKPDSGQIQLDGEVLYDSQKRINLPPQKRRVGYLFQQYALFPNMTVEENITCGALHMTRSEKKDAVTVMVERMKLSGQEKKRPGELSGGQQQRVALARILINKPKLLMLDEPFSALDSHLRWQLELELAETIKTYKGTTLLVSHKQDEVYRLSDSVCVLCNGHAEHKRPVQDLFNTPSTMAECLILGVKNISRARPVDSCTVEAIDWGTVLCTAKAIPRGTTHVAVKEEDLVFANGEAANKIYCRIDQVIEDVSSKIVMFSTPGNRSGSSGLQLRVPKTIEPKPAESDSLCLHVDPSRIMLIKQ